MKKRTIYNFLGVPSSGGIHRRCNVPIEVQCDCGDKAKVIEYDRLYRCMTCGREYVYSKEKQDFVLKEMKEN